jgi:hypothetical protein
MDAKLQNNDMTKTCTNEFKEHATALTDNLFSIYLMVHCLHIDHIMTEYNG